MNQKKENNTENRSPNKGTTKIRTETINKIIACLQDTLDFEVLMYFIIYRELKLSDLEDLIIHKSRPTIYRHIQNLLDADLIQESRKEQVRGPIKAIFYRASPNMLNLLPRVTAEEMERMSFKEKNDLYKTIRLAIYPTISFIKNMLEQMKHYLQALEPSPNKELVKVFDQQDFHLNLNFLSEAQYKLFIEEFQKFMLSFMPKMLKIEEQKPEAEKKYVFTMGLLPIRKIIDRLLEEKQKESADIA